MSQPYESPVEPPHPKSTGIGDLRTLAKSQSKFAYALRETFREGYSRKDLRADVMAGAVVGIVALPLSMALAIASGAPPQYGIYTAIVAGCLAAALGGSRFQVTGPTAAFVAILAPIAASYGLGGLLLATVMAGVALLLMGASGMGRLIEFVPYPVVVGFTAGIAVVIASLQVKDFLGLTLLESPDHFFERLAALYVALPTVHWPEVAVGVFTLLVLAFWPRLSHRLPSPLVALGLSAVAAYALSQFWPEYAVATIRDRFSYMADGVAHGGIPQSPPLFVLPWRIPGPDGSSVGLSVQLLETLAPAAFAIAMLSAIESLLSAVVADGVTGKKHDPDAELMGLGVANIVAPFFGGFAATGAIARTATNIRSGARSPFAAIFHALFALIAILILAPFLGWVPMASMAALLLIIAFNMSEIGHFARTVRVAPRSDVLVLLGCFLLTIVFDMVVAVTVGIVLAALLFMKRMSEVTGAKLVQHNDPDLETPLPKGVMIYEIAGPLFFGAAQKAMHALHTVAGDAKIVILDMRAVPAMDGTGLVNLEGALHRLRKAGAFVILAGVQLQPAQVLSKAGIEEKIGELEIYFFFEQAIARARAAFKTAGK